MFKKITSFNDVNVYNNSIIFCDIDETIIEFNGINHKWWKSTFYKYYDETKDYELSEVKTLQEWVIHIQSHKPKYTDLNGFLNLMEKINNTNSKIIFITARDKSLINLTKKHFDYLELYNHQVHHVGVIKKGDFIINNINLDGFDNFIFIDDLEGNIDDVKTSFMSLDKHIDCYQFKL